MKKTGNYRPRYTHYVSFVYEDHSGMQSYKFKGGVGKKITDNLINWYLKNINEIVSEPPFVTRVNITNVMIVKRGL